jgi:hypothetical protein
MRLAVSVALLVITALNVRFGRPQDGLFLANLAAGVLLALSVVVDRLLPMNSAPAEHRGHPDALHPEPK